MEYTVNQRIKEVVDYLKLSNNEFAKNIGVPSSTISNVFNRDGDVKTSIVTAILFKYDNISPEWLLLGKGDMIKAELPIVTNEESKDLLETYAMQVEKLLERKDNEIRSLQLEVAMLKSIRKIKES